MSKLAWTKRHNSNGSIDHVIELAAPVEVGYHGEVATHIFRWYNRQETSWVTAFGTPDEWGMAQIGSSEYSYSKADSDADAETLIADALAGKAGRYA